MRQARYLFALFESRSWQTLQPDRGHSLIVTGQGDSQSIGTYWLAYLTDDNALHFRRAGQDSGTSFAAPYTYAALPVEYPTNPQSLTDQWSFFGSVR